MPATALADALPDFGKRQAQPPRPAPAGAAVRPVTPLLPPQPAEPDPAMTMALEIARAEAAIVERLEKIHADALAEEQARHAAAMAALEQRYTAEFAERITARMRESEQHLVSTMTEMVARILAVTMSQDVQRRSVEALAASLSSALADSEAMRMRVTGPLSLYEALRGNMGALAERLDYSESDAFDLTVTFDDHVIETRLADWSRMLSEAVS